MDRIVKYRKISEAALDLGLSEKELIHLAANREITLYTAISPFNHVSIHKYFKNGDSDTEWDARWFHGLVALSALHAMAVESGENPLVSYFSATPEDGEKHRYVSTFDPKKKDRQRFSDISIYILESDIEAIKRNKMKSQFDHRLCDRQFGTSIINGRDLKLWIDANNHATPLAIPRIDYDSTIQVEWLLSAIERGAQQEFSRESAAALIAKNEELAKHIASDGCELWLIGAERREKWANLISQAVASGDLILYDPVTRLKIESSSSKPDSETPSQRRARITKYVDDGYAAGKEKQTSYKELAAIEGCGWENIKRIYLDKDKMR